MIVLCYFVIASIVGGVTYELHRPTFMGEPFEYDRKGHAVISGMFWPVWIIITPAYFIAKLTRFVTRKVRETE